MHGFILPDECPLSSGFFDREPALVAPDLLGTLLVSTADGVLAGGRIVETEAYLGAGDPGSHASTKGITARNRVMYGPPGTVYVYFTYGNHYMLNLVCGREGVAGAVLIRAIEPAIGLELMRERRHHKPDADLCNGPGKLAAALGIDLTDNGSVLGQGRIVVYDAPRVPRSDIAVTGRIGLSAGHELDLRFYVRESPFVSRGRPGPAARRAGDDSEG